MMNRFLLLVRDLFDVKCSRTLASIALRKNMLSPLSPKPAGEAPVVIQERAERVPLVETHREGA